MTAVLLSPRDGMLRRIGSSARPLLVLAALLSVGSVGAALVSQHVFDMQPCPWCVLQRLIFLSIGGVALIGAAWPGTAAKRVAATCGLLLAACGLAAALWHYFFAASAASCNMTLADRIIGALQLDRLVPDVFEPRATCADAAVALVGIPYPLWAAALFIACALVLARSLRANA